MASRDQRRQAAGAPPGVARVADPTDAPDPSPTWGRRHLLGAAGVAAVSLAALAPAAQAQQNEGPAGSTPGTTPGEAPTSPAEAGEPAQVEGPDLELVRFARSIELALVQVYEDAIDSGRLKGGARDQAHLFQGHHREHAATMAELAGSQAPNSPNAALLASLAPRVGDAPTDVALMGALQGIEESAAATYLSLLEDAVDWQLATTFSKIAPVDAQHVVAWNRAAEPEDALWAAQVDQVLPVNQGTNGAWSPAQYPVGAA